MTTKHDRPPPPIVRELGPGIVVGLLTSPDRARALGWRPDEEKPATFSHTAPLDPETAAAVLEGDPA